MALLKIIRGTQTKISSRPVSDGALLFATDTKKIYLDNGSSRVEMTSVPDLTNYITSTQLSSAIAAEASARQKQDQLLEQAIDDKLGADDIIAGSNVQISHDEESGHITISATDTKDTNTTYTLTKSGSTITLNGSDGSKTSVTDANTTYTLSSFGVTATATELNYMDGVTSNVQSQLNGKAASSHTHSNATTSAAGFLPKLGGGTTNFLRADGTWAKPPDTNTTYSNMRGATSSAAGKAGLVPAPAAGAATRYLRSDGTWQVPPDTNTTYTLGSFGITATAAEINKLDGLTATTAELNYVDGVTSNIQTQLNGKAASSHSHNYAGSSSAGGAATSAAKLNGISLILKNLNDYHSGVNFYYGGGGNNCTNKPSGVDNFGMFVFQTANGWWTQLLYGSDDHLYMRRWASNSWTSWVEIYSSNNKPTASEIGAAASLRNHSAANITSGTLAVARGGTGVSSNPSMLVNLGSTSAASVFATSPKPGITGTLAIAHGGTGATSAASARSNIGAAASDIIAVQSSQPSSSTCKLWIQI